MNPSNPYHAPGTVNRPFPPRRRQPVQQPPSLLTTSLENHARHAGLGVGSTQTPLSTTTTLSSPFSALPQSAHPPSGSAMSASSPMISRQNSTFSTQYNPQQWGPMSNASPQSAIQRSPHPRQIALASRPVGPDGRRIDDYSEVPG